MVFLLGVAFGLWRRFAYGLIAVCVFTAGVSLIYMRQPEWVWMGLLDPKAVPWWVPFYILGLYPLLFAGGFFTGDKLKGDRRFIWLVLLGGILLGLAFITTFQKITINPFVFIVGSISSALILLLFFTGRKPS